MGLRLTKKTVDAATYAEAGQYFVWDSDLKGFGLRVTPTRKTYIVQSRVKGRTVRHTIGLHGQLTPDQARKLAHDALSMLANGVNVNEAVRDESIRSVTLKDAYNAYIASRKLSDNTLRDYEKAMRLGFEKWGDQPIAAINRNMVESRFTELTESSAAQANQMFRFLRAVINFAKEKYRTADGQPLMHSNPCDLLSALRLWGKSVRRERYIEPTQLKPWFAALTHDPDESEHRKTVKDFCAFVLLTGCREQEAAKLSWDDVDLRAGVVRFAKTKNGKTHVLPVGQWLLELLKRRQSVAPLPTLGNPISFVFPAENASGHLKNHSKAIKAICSASGVEFRLHDLRRTFASVVNHQLARAVSAYTVKRLLNHASTDVTGGYIQFGIEDLREPMRLVEEFVLKCAGIVPSATVHELGVRGAA